MFTYNSVYLLSCKYYYSSSAIYSTRDPMPYEEGGLILYVLVFLGHLIVRTFTFHILSSSGFLVFFVNGLQQSCSFTVVVVDVADIADMSRLDSS